MQNASFSNDGGKTSDFHTVESEKSSTLDHLLIASSIIVLIGSEIWFTVLASVWAVDGILQLPLIGDIVLGGVLAIPALWASYHLVRMAAFSC